MLIDEPHDELIDDLVSLLESGRLPVAEEIVAQQCVRRISQPLRLIVVGTDSSHAFSLFAMLSGLETRASAPPNLRLQYMYSPDTVATVENLDGVQRSFELPELESVFEDSPFRIKIGANLPVLKKLSFMVSARQDEKGLSKEVEQTLLASDIAMFAGSTLGPSMKALLSNLPDHLKHHSYLTLSPQMPAESWQEFAGEFADVLTIDPTAALAAKSAAGGVDKDAFRAAGGTALVKAVKRELDVLKQSALDAAHVLLERYSSSDPHVRNEGSGLQALGRVGHAQKAASDKSTELDAETTPFRDEASPLENASSEPVHTQSELDNSAGSGTKKVTPRRVRSSTRKKSKGSPATPWSLNL